MSELANAMDQVRTARWEGWKRMAAKLPDHHVLSVELFRTEANETLAVFTVVKSGRPVQHILRGNAWGTKVRALVPAHHDGSPIRVGPSHHVEAMLLSTLATTEDGEAYSISLGEPPPKQPPDPGIVALGTVMLASAFDVGEQLTGGSST